RTPFPVAAIMLSAGMQFQQAVVFWATSREALMDDSSRSGRRQFLKRTAALAGVAVGAGAGTERAARGQSAKPEVPAKDATKDAHVAGEHLRRGVLPRRGVRMSVDHITFYTPLQDFGGIITPSHLHFVQQHSSHFPEIDAQQHRLTIHGLVDR